MSVLRRVRSEEEGVVLVLVAMLMVVLLGAAALAIDLGGFEQARQQAQSAADAAALAGADDLVSNASGVSSDVTKYVNWNDPGAASSVSTSARQVTVTVSKSVAAPAFGAMFGVKTDNVSATATAGSVGTEGNGAIFAMDQACGTPSAPRGITLNGLTGTSGTTSGLKIQGQSGTSGAVDSNGGLTVEGYASSTFGDVTYNKNCTPTVTDNPGSVWDPSSSIFSSGPVTRTAAISSWPVDYSSINENSSQCTYTSSSGIDFEGDADVGIFAAGVYCFKGPVILKDDTNFGPAKCTSPGVPSGCSNTPIKVTLIAPSITITNIANVNVAPYINNDLLIEQTNDNGYGAGTDYSANPCTISANVANGATVFVPNGTLVIQNSTGLDFNGYLEAQDVQLLQDGNDTFAGNGPEAGGTAVLQQ